jgi:hypothetical protein
VNAKDEKERTPLDIAQAERPDEKVAAYLVAHGAKDGARAPGGPGMAVPQPEKPRGIFIGG